MASKTYNGRTFTTGDTIYFAKFGTRIDSGYASNSGKYGTCHAAITSLYEKEYAFPIYITGKVTTPSSGTFTGCTVKPSDCSKGYQVKVTYSHNGGSGTASQTGYVGKSLTGTSSRSGYTFAGWYTAASGGSKVTTIPKDAKTYYAHWTANKYTVTLNGQSATTAGTTSVSATFGSAMPAITKPTRTGYTFGGYYTSTGGAGTQYYTAAGASARSYDYAGARTLYAKWTANKYTVVFDGNGATSGTMQNESFSYGTAQALTSNAFSRGNTYKFIGWNTDKNATTAKYTNGQSVSNLTATSGGTVTLYAIWEQQYLTPTLNITKCMRYAQDPDNPSVYTEDDVGTHIHLEFDWSVSTNIDENNEAIDLTIECKERDAPDTDFEVIFNRTGSLGNQGTFNDTDPVSRLSTEKTYTVRVSISDSLGYELEIPAPQAQSSDYISTAFFTLDFSNGDPTATPPIIGGHGIGIGSPAPVDGLRVGLETEFVDSITTDQDIFMYDAVPEQQGSYPAVDTYGPNGELRGIKLAHGEADHSAAYMAIRTDTDYGVFMGIGTGGVNRGLYDNNTNKWIVYKDVNGRTCLPTAPYLLGHDGYIGQVVENHLSSATNVATATWKALFSIKLTAGTWIIIYGTRMAGNTNGYRVFNISTTSAGSDLHNTVAALPTATTFQARSSCLVRPTGTETTYYMNVYQNSGSTLSYSASGTGYGNFAQAIRIL